MTINETVNTTTVNGNSIISKLASLLLCQAATNELLKETKKGLAINYLIKAISLQNCSDLAVSILGFIWEFGLDGIDIPDYSKAEELYQLAITEHEQSMLSASRLAFLKVYGRPGISIDCIQGEKMKAMVNEMSSRTGHRMTALPRTTWIEFAAGKGLPEGNLR